jgi:hypothetical protein
MDINILLDSLSEDKQNRIAMRFDNGRSSFMLESTTVEDWQGFEHITLDYYCHLCRVVGGGDHGDASQNLAEAKNLALRGAGRNATIKKLFRDAVSGADGGMRRVLDYITDAMKQQYIERYIADAFDAYIAPCSIDEATEIMRQFLQAYQHILPSHIDIYRPEYYASNYKEYIGLFSRSMTSVASEFRKL